MAKKLISVSICDVCGNNMNKDEEPVWLIYEKRPGKKARKLDVCMGCSDKLGEYIGRLSPQEVMPEVMDRHEVVPEDPIGINLGVDMGYE
jgi:hypothetical protein